MDQLRGGLDLSNLFELEKTLHKEFLQILLSWFRIRIKKAAESGSALRKTAGSGFGPAKNECRSTALLTRQHQKCKIKISGILLKTRSSREFSFFLQIRQLTMPTTVLRVCMIMMSWPECPWLPGRVSPRQLPTPLASDRRQGQQTPAPSSSKKKI